MIDLIGPSAARNVGLALLAFGAILISWGIVDHKKGAGRHTDRTAGGGPAKRHAIKDEIEDLVKGGQSYAATALAERGPAIRKRSRRLLFDAMPYLSFTGVASRREYVLAHVFLAAFWASSFVVGVTVLDAEPIFFQFTGLLLLASSAALSLWLSWAVSARRTRDTGVTVWWVLTLLVPPLNLAAVVFLVLVPTNEFEGRGI